MPTTYAMADKDVTALLARVVQEYHPDLAHEKVTIEVLMAANEDGPAVTCKGWPALAVARVNSLSDRAAGLSDARIIIDAAAWERASDAEREALLDHEVNHFDLLRDKLGRLKVDDLDRPRLKLRKHDFECGVFYAVARRHGEAAPDTRALASAFRRCRQLEIDWDAAPEADGVEGELVGAA